MMEVHGIAASQADLPGGLTDKRIVRSSVMTQNHLIGLCGLMAALLRFEVLAAKPACPLAHKANSA